MQIAYTKRSQLRWKGLSRKDDFLKITILGIDAIVAKT